MVKIFFETSCNNADKLKNNTTQEYIKSIELNKPITQMTVTL